MPFASKVFLVRPSRFGYNPQTAGSNAFQKPSDLPPEEISWLALKEFEAVAEGLENAAIEVVISDDPPEPFTPDAVFPNNWFSTHPDKTLCLYPMEAPARRRERHPRHLDLIRNHAGTLRFVDLTGREREKRYLEGTGSLVIDHEARKAYACVSSRTDPALAAEWAEITNHRILLFSAIGSDGTPVYHTNVLMCVGNGFAVLCSEAIADERERDSVITSLQEDGKELIEISFEQMERFAGNMLQLRSPDGGHLLVMSERAARSLTEKQEAALSRHTRIAAFPIPTIEDCGGGSVRCMIAEIF